MHVLQVTAVALLLADPAAADRPARHDLPVAKREPALAADPAAELPRAVPRPVVVLSIEGVIDPPMVRYVERGYRVARERDAQAVVLEVSTPGGLESSMREIVQQTLNASVPTLAYVSPRGARAASAGCFIVLACHLTAMAPGTTMGAAHPVGGKGEDIAKHLDVKITNDTAAFIRSLATQRHRDLKWAEDAVRKSLSVNEGEALKLKLVDAVADDLGGVLAKFDGKTVQLDGDKRTLKLKGAPLVAVDMSWRERFFHVLAHPELAYILLTLGTLGLIFELQSPHGVTGIVGAVCLVLALISLSVIPFSAGGLMLMALGVGLFIADIKLASHGALALAGAVCLLLGSLMLFSPIEPFWHVSRALILSVAAIFVVFFSGIVWLGLSAQRIPAATGREVLPGTRGVALTALAPDGQVRVQGEIWSAVLAAGAPALRRGAGVVVTSVHGLTLEVEPAEGAADDRASAKRRPRA